MQTDTSTTSAQRPSSPTQLQSPNDPTKAGDEEDQENIDRRDQSTADDTDDGNDEDRNAAALVLQRTFRGHQTRNKMKGASLDGNDRWDDALNQGRLKTAAKEQDVGKHDPASRWKRSLAATAQLQRGDGVRKRSPSDKQNPQIPDSHQGSDGRSSTKRTEADDKADSRNKPNNLGILAGLGLGSGQNEKKPKVKESLGFRSKQLEQTQWLELIDPKHRYGSNLKHYHRAWEEAETVDNFYRWLDRGDGKDLSLPECQRSQLEKERITYLSAEQRLNYLVLVDDDGHLRWARNDELLDTSPNKWKDVGHGQGIVPKEAALGVEEQDEEPEGMSSASSISSSDLEDDDNLQENHQTHYTDDQPTSKLGKIKERFTLKGASQRMLRKTVAKNTWIYVSDMQYNLFVGMKTTGTFQHSSFLSGGQVTCAGLIQCRDGQIQSLSPLSGHYRGSIEHYKNFISHLDEIGTDLSKVRIGKAEVTMWGIQQIGKASKKKKSIGNGFKRALHIGSDKSLEQKSEEKKKEAEAKEGSPDDDEEEEDSKDEDGNSKHGSGKVDEFKRAVFYGKKQNVRSQTSGDYGPH